MINKSFKVLLGAMLVLGVIALGIPDAMSYTIDGDVGDWGIDLNLAGTDGYLNDVSPTSQTADYFREDYVRPEDGYLGPGFGGQIYDAEAIYFDNDSTHGYIAIITGFPEVGTAEHGTGDIALNIDCDGNTGGYGYEYGIDTATGNIIHMPVWDEVSIYSIANPWTINDASSPDYNAALVYSAAAINDHYVIEASFLLADLGLGIGDTFDMHWTMECGNDILDLTADIGGGNENPEPATLILMGSGLIGLAGLGRKKTKH